MANSGELAANGILARVQRTLLVSGLNTAFLDIREHSEAHHQVMAQLVDRLGEQDRPYDDLSRAERRALLSTELTSRRPLTSLPAPLDAAGATTSWPPRCWPGRPVCSMCTAHREIRTADPMPAWFRAIAGDRRRTAALRGGGRRTAQ